MRKLALALVIALFAMPAFAQDVKFESGTIAVGDPVEKLLKVAGEPDRIEPFPGMPAFERYEYFPDGRNISLTVKDGTVTGIGVLEFTSK